ncbi:GTP-binding protein [Litchfieldia alkalitelluris]|uniref:GTP-binding protein n=1 Tax=Litchfieldia alkalitelluris TaxID=304268 RepID=UPI000998C316|nr:TetM/TetW/TetO/TetS family tetracycline resistance ribosomal protection protein [Litchfieldia alkalitelluris]
MNKTIGILAHVDAGKTTFSEQLLYHTKSIKNRGRVDHKNAFLDSHEIEKQRGITVFADQGTFYYQESTYFLIDTPGHVDFSPEMERAIQVMDYAVIIISAVEGIEGHTETVWELLRKHRIPTFFFINKTDRTGANVENVIKEIQGNLTTNVYDMTQVQTNLEIDEELIEFVAERDETLLNTYLEGKYNKKLWIKNIQKMILYGHFFPLISGSALHDIGIGRFIEILDCFTITNHSSEGPFSGQVYKIRHESNGTKITFVKSLSGTLKVRDEIATSNEDSNQSEKVTGLRTYSGNKFKTVEQVGAGELFAVMGLSNPKIGDKIGVLQEKNKNGNDMVPTLKSKVTFEAGVNPKEVLQFFKMLDAEDPSLNVLWDERFQEIHIHVMGNIQLEVLEQVIKDRFKLTVLFETPEILYKETITNQVKGYGHFEPLGHYAEVHFQLEPGERNSGILFENSCHADDLSVGHQRLIEQHLFEREHHGILTGSSLTDVKITLLTGRAHNKHTSGGDFQEATFRALRQGLEKAENTLLEPFYQYKIKVNIEQMGRVLSDIQQAYGYFNPPVTEGDKAILTGTVPVSTFMNYSNKLATLTQGKGSISLIFSGYNQCHNEEEVIDSKSYNKQADPDYTSSSIFCSKGQGYSVPWNEAEEKMHCL